MSSSGVDRNLVDALHTGYRVAFARWISARKTLSAQRPGTKGEAAAQPVEVAAARDYRDARDHLTEAMLCDGNHLDAKKELGYSSPKVSGAFRWSRLAGCHGWRIDFALILALTVLTVGIANWLADLVSATR